MTTDEKRELASQLYRQGHTQTAIARQLKVSGNTLTKWKRRFKWGKLHVQGRRQQQREAGFTLYCQRLSQQDIARQLGISENTVTKWKREEDWENRARLAASDRTRNDLVQLGQLVQAEAQRQPASEQAALLRAYAHVSRLLDFDDLADLYGLPPEPPQ